ncbi:endothelin-converting enzyme-like 1 [Schistocerca nitens]|uniref:endothelin-converting enzyme-like 1 n=1 Tax=Schistocerca nitens TaxID=7011 RepID=UPI0021194C3A|nr:endothelin-converting enzyme-like 1 [Schistocerca nitens]
MESGSGGAGGGGGMRPRSRARASNVGDHGEMGRQLVWLSYTAAATTPKHRTGILLAAVDWRADPCADFYGFACGAASNRAPPPLSFAAIQRRVDAQIQQLLSEATEGVFAPLAAFQRSCVSSRGSSAPARQMRELLESLGGYLPPGQPEPADLAPLVAELLRINSAPLFDVFLERAPHNRSAYAVFIDLPRRSQLSQDVPAAQPDDSGGGDGGGGGRRSDGQPKESSAYRYIKDSADERRLSRLERVLQQLVPAALPADHRARELHAALLLASALDKLYPREKELANSALQRSTPVACNLTQLQTRYGFLDWRLLLEAVFSANFSDSELFYVAAPDYLSRLHSILIRFSKRTVHNALLGLLGRDSLHQLEAVAGDAARCARLCVALFSQEVAALYLRQYPRQLLDTIKNQARQLLERLKSALEARVRLLPWLDATSREAALAKLAALRAHLLTMPGLSNHTYVAALLHDVDVRQDDLFGNVLRRYRQLRAEHARRLRQPADDDRWAYPFVVNAFYEKTLNSIVVPLALLAQPYLRSDVPRYVPLGALGTALAHELLHALDSAGVERGPGGQPHAWLTPAARLRFEARLDCLARQYHATFMRSVPFLGASVPVQFDWNVTRAENMADVAGVQVAYEAWRSQQEAAPVEDARLPDLPLAPQQLFFLHAAQIYCTILSPEDYIILVEMDFHTPSPERVNGMMMNSPDFSEAYNCPIGSAMNPVKKCSTW